MSHTQRVLIGAFAVALAFVGIATALEPDPGTDGTAGAIAPAVVDSMTPEVTTDIVDGDVSTTSAAPVVAPASTAAATTLPPGATDADCPATSRGAIIDRANQRGALCENGAITYRFPLTSAVSQPDPGNYEVFAKDMNTSSTFGGHYSTMTHFVAFTRGKYKGARIAFHSMPKLRDGSYVQTLESVGTPEMFGESSGCIRVLPDDAVRIWDWMSEGDSVRVIS